MKYAHTQMYILKKNKHLVMIQTLKLTVVNFFDCLVNSLCNTPSGKYYIYLQEIYVNYSELFYMHCKDDTNKVGNDCVVFLD